MTTGSLGGRRILIVEDEYFQAQEMRAMLARLGGHVAGPTGCTQRVAELVEAGGIDAALVDINLGSGPSFETADLLEQEGIPFAFLTGYGEPVIPGRWAATPRLQKPVNEGKVRRLLGGLL